MHRTTKQAMSAVNPNPYAPPPTESFLDSATPSMETLKEFGPIEFSGSLDDQALREFLRADGHVGCAYLRVPTDAIAFDGVLRASDLSLLPNKHRRREKPTRSYVVVGALFVSGAFIVAGVSNLLFQQFALLPTLVTIYIAIAAIGVAVKKRLRGRSNSGIVLYLNAYATESSIVSDFAITTTQVAWSTLQVVAQRDDFVAFRRLESIQFIVARRDMFADDETWFRFNELATRALPSF